MATYQTYTSIGQREDLSDVIYSISPTDTPFMSSIGKAKATATNHEWQTDALASAVLTNAAVEGDTASDATLTVTLPTATLLDAAVPSAKIGSAFELTICNNNNTGASSTVPVTTGTGITIFGSVTIPRFGAHTYRFVKTGDNAFSAFLK